MKTKKDVTYAILLGSVNHNDTQREREKTVEQASDSRVMLTGYMDVPSERLNAVKDALIEHINLTRAEKGCILFEVREDDTHPGRFLASEVFENQKAFDAHQNRTRNSDWFNVTEDLPRNYSIRVPSTKTDY